MFSYMKKNLKIVSVSKYFTNLKVDKIISQQSIINGTLILKKLNWIK